MEQPAAQPSQVNTKESSFIKSEFPKIKLLYAIAILLVGLLFAGVAAYFAPLNPLPFEQKFNPLEPGHWVMALEKNGIYRTTLINKSSPIEQYAVVGQQLGIQFADGSRQLIMPQGVLSGFSQNDSEEVATVDFINFKFDSLIFSDTEKTRLKELLTPLVNQDNLVIVLTGVVGQPEYKSEQSEQISLPTSFSLKLAQPPQQSTQKQPNQPSANPNLQQSSYKEVPQQVLKDTQPTGISREYAISHGLKLANVVRDYILDQVAIEDVRTASYGIERYYGNSGWQRGRGELSGVVIELTYTSRNISWQPFPLEQSIVSIEISDNATEKWQVLNGSIFNFIDNNANEKTVAASTFAFMQTDPEFFNVLEADTPISASTNLPAPQLYPSALSILILLVFVALAFRVLKVSNNTDNADVLADQKIIDNFISDAPASDRSQDKLGFVEISKALSSFLRNIGTKAPLTLAITGVWGSGKSSLMYFLKQNLESYQLRPVWINAWHHQNEAQFLAGLLNSVRAHAIPEFWTSAGILYRWNLFKMRWAESPLLYMIASLFFFGSLSYWITLQDVSLNLPENANDKEAIQNYTAIFTTLAGGIPLVLAAMDKISLLVSSSNPLRRILGSPGGSLDLRSNVGLRDKFAQEFHMLCKALGDSTLTIFIDDLDRCKESRIMDVMETLNYLVSSGDCYIVLAMELEPVEKAIINYYRGTHSDLTDEQIRLKASRYLEKIINIEIPVPTASSAQVSSLIAPSDIPETPTKTILQWLGPLVFVCALIGSVILGANLSGVVSFGQSDLDLQTQTKSSTPNTITNEQSDSLAETKEMSEPSEPQEKPFVWTINSPEPERNYAYFIFPFLIAGLIAIVIRVERYRQRRQIVEEDSAPFLSAISIWAQALGSAQHTPRRIKRYVNRARYLAMRNIASGADIKDDNLVTLAALLEFAERNEFTDLDSLKHSIPNFENQKFQAQIQQLLDKSEHISEVKKALFLHWIKGVRVNIN